MTYFVLMCYGHVPSLTLPTNTTLNDSKGQILQSRQEVMEKIVRVLQQFVFVSYKQCWKQETDSTVRDLISPLSADGIQVLVSAYCWKKLAS